MNRTPGLIHVIRWGLPWLGVVAISVSLAYGMTVALAGEVPGGDPPAAVAVAQMPADALVSGVPGWSGAIPAAIYRISGSEACYSRGTRSLYVGLNSWIPAEPMVAPCAESVP